MSKAFFGPVTPEVPASILQLHSDVVIVADEAALSKIRSRDMKGILEICVDSTASAIAARMTGRTGLDGVLLFSRKTEQLPCSKKLRKDLKKRE